MKAEKRNITKIIIKVLTKHLIKILIWIWNLKPTKGIPSGSIWYYGFGKELSPISKPHAYLQKVWCSSWIKNASFQNVILFLFWCLTYSFSLINYNTSDICSVNYLTTLINKTFCQGLCNPTNTPKRVVNPTKVSVT